MSSKKLFLIFLLILAVAAGRSSAQDVPRIDQDFVKWTQVAVDGNHRPGSKAYQHPSGAVGLDFQAAVEAFLDEDWALADDLAGNAGYEVISIHDTATDTGDGGDVFYGLIPQANNGDGRGFYFVRPRANVQRRLVIQAPHAVEDERTGVLGSEMFLASGARALMLTGADRCASDIASTCSGSTDCGAHTVADGAHAVGSFFYIFSQLAGREHADTYVLQLHGFKVDAGEPEFSVSDGTETNHASTYITNMFYQNLQNRMQAVVTTLPRNGNSCNGGIGHTDFQCGTFSVQGRDLNGSDDACHDNATTATGRFLHLELSNDLREPGELYSQQLVIDTVTAIFPKTAAVGDRVWADRNDNGDQQAGEHGVPDARVEVLDASNNVIGSTLTRNGIYRIGNLDAGTYRLRVQLPDGYTYGAGVDPNGRSFTISAGQLLTSVDVPLVPSGVSQIGDRVWLDTDEDGLFGSESGAGGVIVELLHGDTFVDMMMTISGGDYSFPDVPPGNYRLRVSPTNSFAPTPRGFTVQGTGDVDGDSEISPATGKSPVFRMDGGVNDNTRDVGIVSPCYDVDLVAANSIWKYWVPGASDTVPADWNEPSFSDSAWEEGFSPLGSDSGAMTDTGNPDAANGRYTTYFRLSFEGADPLAFQGGLQLTLTRKGGVIVYLNGTEILRRNLPWGAAVGAGLPASTEADTVETVSIPAALLLSGSNLLAVELHQYEDDDDGELSDGLFDLELTGRVCGSCRVKETVLTTTKATFIKSSSTGSNSGTSDMLELDGGVSSTGAPSDKSVLVAWDLSSIPQGAGVLHAEMVVTIGSGSASSDEPYALHELLRSWDESGSTGASWNHAIRTTAAWQTPGALGSNDSSPVRLGLMPLDSGIDVSATVPLNPAGRSVVEKWIDNPATNFGFLIEAEPDTDDGLDFRSDDHLSGGAPQLRVIYLDPTCQP